MKDDVVLTAHITCPGCGAVQTEVMPEDQCVFFWRCPVCTARWMPKKDDCCVYCSYADIPCPSVQRVVKCDNH